MVHCMGPRGEVQAVRGHLMVLEPGMSSPIHIAGGSIWDWSLSTPEVLCGSLLFLTLMWLRVFSTVCSGSAFSGVRCPLGLPCVWPRAPVLHGAVSSWKLSWLWVHSSWRYFCSSVTLTFSGLGSVCPCPSPRAVLHLFQVAKAHLFCGARSLMVKHKQLSVSIPFFYSYPPTWLIYPHVPPCTVQDCHSTGAGCLCLNKSEFSCL